MRSAVITFFVMSVCFGALTIDAAASPVLGWETIKPATAAEKGVRFTFFEYQDGRIRVTTYLDPKPNKSKLDLVKYATVTAAAYLDGDKKKLISESKVRLMPMTTGKLKGILRGDVVLHKDTLDHVKLWIEFGNADGYMHFDIKQFLKQWQAKPKE